MLVQEFSFMFDQLKMIMFTVIQHSKENWIFIYLIRKQWLKNTNEVY